MAVVEAMDSSKTSFYQSWIQCISL